MFSKDILHVHICRVGWVVWLLYHYFGQTYADLCSNQAKAGNKDSDSNWDKHMDLSNGDIEVKRIEPPRKSFLSFFWKRWPQKTSKKNAFELMEFAGDLSSEDNNAQSSSH